MSSVTATVAVKKHHFACTDKESTRYALAAAEVRNAGPGKVSIASTDARMLAICFASGELRGADSVLIPPEMGKGKKYEKAKLDDGYWQVGDTHKRLPDGRFPKISDVLPNEYERGYRYPPCESVVIQLNAKLLANLAAVISPTDGCVTLIAHRNCSEGQYSDKMMLVVGEEGIGAAMPLVDKDYKQDAVKRALDRFYAAYRDYLTQDQPPDQEAPAEREAVAAS